MPEKPSHTVADRRPSRGTDGTPWSRFRGDGDADAGRPPASRGVAEVMSYIFVFALIAISITIVSVTGVGSLNDARVAEQAGNAATAFDILHNNMADLYTENAPSRATEISLGESEVFFGEAVTVNVTVVEGGDTTVTEHETRPIVQRLERGNQVVYEAGAVFRTEREGGITLRTPPFTIRSGTVHVAIPALQSDANRSLGGKASLVRGEVTNTAVTARDTEGNVDEIIVTVTSPRYERWESYLSEQPGFDCDVDHATNRVTCTRDTGLDRVYVVVHEGSLSLIN